MHHSTDTKPAAAAPHADRGTGTTGKASTLARDESRLAGNLRRSIAYFDAAEARHRAEADENRAMAEVHRGNPLAPSADRVLLAQGAEDLAKLSDRRAISCAKLAAEFREKLPQPDPVNIEIVLVIGHDSIRQTARVAGHGAAVARTWARIGTGTWRCRDPRWDDSETVLGEELCEYLNFIPLPEDVATAIAALASARASAKGGAHD
ncbi:hypothetical protein [Lysobacter sp. CA199]|uniref:hypothetical protein n=1 Tax=Lysobacter sp. CA199 TaxID=3455608 RepID=UPI003F8D7219